MLLPALDFYQPMFNWDNSVWGCVRVECRVLNSAQGRKVHVPSRVVALIQALVSSY